MLQMFLCTVRSSGPTRVGVNQYGVHAVRKTLNLYGFKPRVPVQKEKEMQAHGKKTVKYEEKQRPHTSSSTKTVSFRWRNFHEFPHTLVYYSSAINFDIWEKKKEKNAEFNATAWYYNK